MTPFSFNQTPGNRVMGSRRTERVVRDFVYELTGTLHQIGEIQHFDRGFKVLKFALMSDATLPTPISLDLLGDNVSLIDGFSVGQRLLVTFKLKGREWEGRYFTNLHTLTIQAEEGNQPKSVDLRQTPAEAPDDPKDIPF